MSVSANKGWQSIRTQAGLLVLLALSGLLAAGCSERKPAGPPTGTSAAVPETVAPGTLVPADATSAARGGAAPSAAAAKSPAASQPPAPAAKD